MTSYGIPQYESASMRQRDLAERRCPGQNHGDGGGEWNEAFDLGYDPMEIDDVLEDPTKRWEKFRKA